MKRTLIFSFAGLIIGLVVGYVLNFRTPVRPLLKLPGSQIVGFLPYWLASRAAKSYPDTLTTLAYFSLTIDSNGNIQKLANEQEEEPGWHALTSGLMDPFFEKAKKNNQLLSLVVFSGDNDSINTLVNDPIPSAQHLTQDVLPIMKKYGFTELNLDIESTSVASEEARKHFTQFVKEVKRGLGKSSGLTLSLDISPSAFIKKYLVDPVAIASSIDPLIVMGYDYHYQGSAVTGPVAPLFGAGIMSEFDIQTAVQKALDIMPAQKIILGVPLYGYEWETIDDTPRSAVIPGTGLAASSNRVSQLLSNCSTCNAQFDKDALEKYIIYKDTETNTYHQLFYPDKQTMQAKILFAQKNHLGGMALWAMGYEDATILDPLKNYQ
ncbi:MAG: hypothetical protein HYT83_03810 [Candidatus Levybacteria bacterium]|nr:hypothetical protein [Candidatus Levybacteria bacterium]